RLRRELSPLSGGGENSVADRLGENELVARSRSGVCEEKIGMRTASHRETVFELGVHHGVSPDDERSGLVNLVLASRQDSAQDIEREVIGGKCDNVERGERLAAH